MTAIVVKMYRVFMHEIEFYSYYVASKEFTMTNKVELWNEVQDLNKHYIPDNHREATEEESNLIISYLLVKRPSEDLTDKFDA